MQQSRCTKIISKLFGKKQKIIVIEDKFRPGQTLETLINRNDMRNYENKLALHQGRRAVVFWLPERVPKFLRKTFWTVGLIVLTHFATQIFWKPGDAKAVGLRDIPAQRESLYLLEHAQPHVRDLEAFGQKVIHIAEDLMIPPEWLMAVMYAESKLNPGIANLQGSGAIGLIQFMPATAHELGVTTERLQRMDALQQMEYVYLYLQKVRDRYGPYQSLTDLYLGILFPKARGQDYCYTIFAKPSTSYQQNKGLDKNKDGRVTVSDVDRHLRELFPEAYIMNQEEGMGFP